MGENIENLTNNTSKNIELLIKLGIEFYYGPKNKKMCSIRERKNSFINSNEWNKNNCSISINLLAEAGFYYYGFSDAVKCFHCGLALCQWKEFDNPWIEHVENDVFDCGYLKLNRIEDLDNQKIISKEKQLNKQLDINFLKISDSKVVKELLNLNIFPKELVDEAIQQQYFKERKAFSSFAYIYDSVATLQTILERIEIKAHQNKMNQDEKQKESKAITKINNNKCSCLFCLVCYSENRNILFLPCQHCAICSSCTKFLNKCPICRRKITAISSVFLS